jgi:hypothetical protein
VHQSSPLVNHPYVYPSTGPLTGDTIRLLEIQPGTPPEPLRCRLIEASLSAVPTYSAISYEWGTSEVYVTIILNDKPFGIRPNLWTFLMHLRDTDTPKVVWVDAVCINQDNKTERGAQVSLMGEIYNRADSTLIWLGAKDSKLKSPLMAINEIFKHQGLDFATVLVCGFIQRDAMGNVVRRMGVEDVLALICKAEEALRSVVIELCSAILGVCERSYWTRTWIIQEIALSKAKTVYFGSFDMEWSLFRRFCAMVANFALKYGGEIEEEANGLQRMPRMKKGAEIGWDFDAEQVISRCSLLQYTRALIFNTQTESDLLDLLESTTEAECTDLRDKVYALLNLSSNRSSLPIPDYDKSSADLLFDVASCYQARAVEVSAMLKLAFKLTQKEIQRVSRLRCNEDSFCDSLQDCAIVDQVLYTSQRGEHASPIQFVLLRAPNKDLFFGESEYMGINCLSVSNRRDNNGFVIALLHGGARSGDGVYRMPFSTTYIVCRIQHHQDESVINIHASVIGRLYPIDTASEHPLPLSDKSIKSVKIGLKSENTNVVIPSLSTRFDREMLLAALDRKKAVVDDDDEDQAALNTAQYEEVNRWARATRERETLAQTSGRKLDHTFSQGHQESA